MSIQPPDNRALLAAVRAWAAANYPGCPLEYLSIHLRFLPVAIRLADSPAAAPSVAQDEGSDDEPIRERKEAPEAMLDILDTLRKVKYRLTISRMLEELNRAKKYHGRRTVERHLRAMVEDGTLNNRQDVSPAGYGFPEWDEEEDK